MNHNVTDQLLTSDAVDMAVGRIDFRDLSGQKVYFDTQYIRDIKGVGFVNSNYIISAMRQQMVAAGCLLQEKADDADFVIEGRLGALGTESLEVTYGIPATNFLNSAAELAPALPPVPTIPEIAFGKRSDTNAAVKLAVFAYHRETRQPVWQSGVSQASSEARDIWVLGAGPFQSGSIYDRAQFAGSELALPYGDNAGRYAGPGGMVAHTREVRFDRPPPPCPYGEVRQARFQNEQQEADKAEKK